ncbi:MAG: DEAD/DEAH box helicase [Flavobacteriales bacterium]
MSFVITTKKKLYDYQKKAIEEIFERLDQYRERYNLLFQLPTGGGKTVIFSEIVRQYLQKNAKKVLILTHRIELCGQTSKMLSEFQVTNKIINSDVKKLEDQNHYNCFVAMVETLNNRLNDDMLDLKNIGLVIIDEAHYNSFTKLFKYFEECFILGVTATPLSSNIKLPMNENYKELIVGEDIASLIDKKFLAKANTYSYNVGLGSLQVGINGDYTVKSSEALYTDHAMQEKLLYTYETKSKGKKTLIFNNGINTSIYVYHTFKDAGYDIRHLDNTNTSQERKEILTWFKKTPHAILTSVSILTTGFDEPSVETIIINRATKSLTLYFQMIGRGSRITKNKKEFNVIDLGNNVARFGLWSSPVNWYKIFKSPNYFLENLISDDAIELQFRYQMPDEIRKKFKNSENITFDIRSVYKEIASKYLKSNLVLKQSLEQHAKICIENSEDMYDALHLAKLLDDDIKDRIKQYSYCISKSTNNFLEWLEEDYKKKLRTLLRQHNFEE